MVLFSWRFKYILFIETGCSHHISTHLGHSTKKRFDISFIIKEYLFHCLYILLTVAIRAGYLRCNTLRLLYEVVIPASRTKPVHSL